MKGYAWYYHLPCNPYAYGPMRFDRLVSEREVRERIREVWGYKRLPRGTEVWITKD